MMAPDQTRLKIIGKEVAGTVFSAQDVGSWWGYAVRRPLTMADSAYPHVPALNFTPEFHVEVILALVGKALYRLSHRLYDELSDVKIEPAKACQSSYCLEGLSKGISSCPCHEEQFSVADKI
nr:hypothetical protein CFP56_62784 [Quercus suber]